MDVATALKPRTWEGNKANWFMVLGMIVGRFEIAIKESGMKIW